MSDANAERGEISIDLEGRAHVLRPSYEAIVAIEAKTGRSIELLAEAAGDGALSLAEAAIVVTECVRAQGKAVGDPILQRYGPERVGELIHEAGKLIVVRHLQLLLFMAANGGYTATGEPRPLPMTTATTGEETADIVA